MSTDDASKLFVAGLPDSLTEDELRQVFEAQGTTVVSLSLPKDKLTGRRRGFGFVTLATPDEASQAREALNGTEQGGRAISVRAFSSGPQRRVEPRPGAAPAPAAPPPSDRTVYVGNLPFDITSADVEQVFVDNGISPVQRVHLPTNPDGRPRGFGFVTVGSAEAAVKAVQVLSSVEVRGRGLQLSIARSRNDRPMGNDRPRPPRAREEEGGAPVRPENPERVESGEPIRADTRRVREKPEAKKRKREKGKRRTERDEFQKRERGGASSFRRWDKDWDEE